MAERVRVTGGNIDGVDNEAIDAQVNKESASLHTIAGQINASNKTYEDASFVTGDSPVTINFYGDTGRVSVDGYVVCDGPGNIQVAVSRDGLIYDDTFTMKEGEVVCLDHVKVNKIRISWTADSAYRVNLI